MVMMWRPLPWMLVIGCSFSTHPADQTPMPDAPTPDSSDAPPAPSGKHRVRLTFHNGTRNADLVDFAVLVVIDATRIDYASCPAGANLRFTDPDGTQLAYEIERWDPAGSSFVWVRVPKIDRSSETDYVDMHYGDASLTDAQMPAQVWVDADAVYHLAQDPGGHGAGDIVDSTGMRAGTTTAAMASTDLIDAKVGQGFRMNGLGAGIHAAAAVAAMYTWSMWVKGDAVPGTSANHEPICDGDGNFNFAWDHLNAGYVGAAAQRDATTWRAAQGTGFAAATWYLLAGTYDGSSLCLYVDGQAPVCTAAGSPVAPSFGLQIGDATSNSTSFKGYLDEVRVYSVAQSALWLDADHASQTDTLIAYGQPVSE